MAVNWFPLKVKVYPSCISVPSAPTRLLCKIVRSTTMLPDDTPVIENAVPGTLSLLESEVDSCNTNCTISVCEDRIELKSASNENDAYMRYVVVVELWAALVVPEAADVDWVGDTAVVTSADDDGAIVVAGALVVVEAGWLDVPGWPVLEAGDGAVVEVWVVAGVLVGPAVVGAVWAEVIGIDVVTTGPTVVAVVC